MHHQYISYHTPLLCIPWQELIVASKGTLSRVIDTSVLHLSRADCIVIVQPEPAPEQVEAKSPKAIILRPATSALPRILCTTAPPPSTQQQSQAGTSTHGGVGSKHKAASEPLQKLSRQRSCSLTPSTDDSIAATQVKCEAGHDSLEEPAHQQASLPATLCKQAKQRATFNVVTSGEYSHLTLKRQLSVKTALPSPCIPQPDAPAGPHHAQPFTFPVGEDGYSASDLYTGGSQSYDSGYLPANEMPKFAFQAGNADIPHQQALWESGPHAQMPHAQSGIDMESTTHGTIATHSKPGDWCSIMAQGLELGSQAPPCMPDLLPLSPSADPPACMGTSWDQPAWQSSWQHQQQHQQQQQLAHTVEQPFFEVATCREEGVTASAGLEFVEPTASGSGADAAWWLLPSCSVENMLQADSSFASGW